MSIFCGGFPLGLSSLTPLLGLVLGVFDATTVASVGIWFVPRGSTVGATVVPTLVLLVCALLVSLPASLRAA